MPIAKLPLQAAAEVALHGGRDDALLGGSGRLIDPIQMVMEDQFLESLAGFLTGQHPSEALAEVSPASQAAELAAFRLPRAVPLAQILRGALAACNGLYRAASFRRSASRISARYTMRYR